MPASIDHLSIKYADFEKAKLFYAAALQPLGIRVLADYPGAAGLGTDGPIFWISAGGKTSPRVHFAFAAGSRAEVDAFYKAAISAGGVDNGPPGIRHNNANYYAAFVVDPEGHNVEAVSHGANKV